MRPSGDTDTSPVVSLFGQVAHLGKLTTDFTRVAKLLLQKFPNPHQIVQGGNGLDKIGYDPYARGCSPDL